METLIEKRLLEDFVGFKLWMIQEFVINAENNLITCTKKGLITIMISWFKNFTNYIEPEELSILDYNVMCVCVIIFKVQVRVSL